MVNFSETVPPLVRFSSCTTTLTPLVSLSAEAMPAGAAADGVAGVVADAVVVVGAAVVGVEAGADDDDVVVGAGSFFGQATKIAARRTTGAIHLVMEDLLQLFREAQSNRNTCPVSDAAVSLSRKAIVLPTRSSGTRRSGDIVFSMGGVASAD